MKNVLNITNGDCFNEHLMRTSSEVCIPFREVMMDGPAVSPVYSERFIAVRADALGVSQEEYKEKMITLDLNDYAVLQLWFGVDTFCQMNLLTLLAYLEQLGYNGKISLNTIDDATFNVLTKNTPVVPGIYSAMYEQLLVNRQPVSTFGVINQHAVELYFDYHSPDGALARLIKSNSSQNETKLLITLLNATAEYGLSDSQCLRLIKQYK